MTKCVDCLIIGAGPAGVAAAISCQQVDVPVLVAAPESPSGGYDRPAETVSSAIERIAEKLSLSECFRSARFAPIGVFLRDGREEIFSQGPEPGWHIDRDRLDSLIQRRLADCEIERSFARVVAVEGDGAGFRIIMSDGSLVSCRAVVDATGRGTSPLKQFYGPRTLLSPPLIATTGVVRSSGRARPRDITRFDSRPWGWIWQTSGYGACSSWTTLHVAQRLAPPSVAALQKASLPGSSRKVAATWQLSITDHQGIFPVGDASGSIDPGGGQGIAHALLTGLACGPAVRRYLQGQTAEAGVAAFNRWRRDLVLHQADQLARYYEDRGIFLTVP